MDLHGAVVTVHRGRGLTVTRGAAAGRAPASAAPNAKVMPVVTNAAPATKVKLARRETRDTRCLRS